MMMSEFIERTGFEPTAEEYREIEERYYDFDGNKDDFCRSWKENGGAARLIRQRAETIENLKAEKERIIRECEKEKLNLHDEILKLQKQLDRELQWKDAEGCGTNVDQEAYEHLRNMPDTKVLSDEEAKQVISSEFGFDPSKIQIVREVKTYEVNKYGRLRKKEEFFREPCTNSTDWNYIRFDVVGSTSWMWEMVSGSLRQYNC